MELLMLILLFALDFLITSAGVAIILFLLRFLGVFITFSWGLAFVVWLILKVLKAIT
jgi:hypothetical protein